MPLHAVGENKPSRLVLLRGAAVFDRDHAARRVAWLGLAAGGARLIAPAVPAAAFLSPPAPTAAAASTALATATTTATTATTATPAAAATRLSWNARVQVWAPGSKLRG